MDSIPEIRKSIKSALLMKGFEYSGQDGSAAFAYQELDVNRLCFTFTLKHLPKGLFLNCDCTFINNILGDGFNYIVNERETVFPINQLTSRSWRPGLVRYSHIENLVAEYADEAIDFAASSSFDKQLEIILSTLDKPGSHQKWHIAALAASKQIDKLKFLLSNLDLPDRGGLFLNIDKPTILRAIEYAEKISS